MSGKINSYEQFLENIVDFYTPDYGASDVHILSRASSENGRSFRFLRQTERMVIQRRLPGNLDIDYSAGEYGFAACKDSYAQIPEAFDKYP